MAAGGGLTAAALCGAGAQAGLRDPVEALRARLRGRLLVPADAGYAAARRGEGTTPVGDRSPMLIVQPEGPDDVARTLDFVRTQGVDVAVRCGGHDLLGVSTPARGVLIDLSRMNDVVLDPVAGVARVGGGARAGALTAAGAPHGLAPALGMNPNVGVGGLTLGGGMGWLAGTHGATVDNLLAVDVVTADGRSLKASADENEDLFWALRGGGGNFGVATAFTYRMRPVPQVLAGDIGYRTDPARFLRFLRDFLATSPDELELGVLFSLGSNPFAITRLCWSGDAAAGAAALRPLRTFASPMLDTVRPQSYAGFANGAAHFDNMFLRGGEFAGLGDEVIDALAAIIERGGPKDCLVGVLHYMHGALCRVPADATPFIRTPGHILYNIVAPWQGAGLQRDRMDWALAASEALRGVNSKGIYINYLSYEGEAHVRDSFGPHHARLRAIKRRYDPENLFHHNRNIRA
ncbi:FAD-binding oxidoreductase [Sphingomonas sp. C8-2]|jgi:FAD/FMN-containing dehydrogenase|nr:FAD-binding oxidoreductase [Sphingomonas sp. C8-2]